MIHILIYLKKYEKLSKNFTDMDIIIAGHFNASFARPVPNIRDKILKDFMSHNNIHVPYCFYETPTFRHPNGSSSSLIDFFIVKNRDILLNYHVDDTNHLNTSTHSAVHTTFRASININQKATKEENSRQSSASYKIRWDTVDIESYRALLCARLSPNRDKQTSTALLDL